jgi:hypothetical protein
MLLVCRSRHTPPHDVSPAEHPATHLPAEHCCPRPQAAPQAPQLRGSADRRVHALPHIASPEPHTQVPPEQAAPDGHWRPHAPQSNGSVARLTHAPLQSARPAAHDDAHSPSEQTCVRPHATPQPPQ